MDKSEAREVREKTIAQIWKAYREAIAPAQKTRDEAITLAWEVWEKAVTPTKKSNDSTNGRRLG